MKCGLLIVSTLLVMSPGVAGAGGDWTEQFWIDYHEHFYINPKWEFYGDGGFRTQPESPIWRSVYVRPSIRYHLARFPCEGRGGLGVFYSYNEDDPNQLEVRPWLGLLLKWPKIGRMTFSSYVRVEDRLIWTLGEDSFDSQLRFRYKLGTKIPLVSKQQEKFWFFPVSAEWFMNVGQDVADKFAGRLRLDGGVGYVFSWVWVAEFHVILQESRSGQSQQFESDDLIFRVMIKRLWAAHDYMSQE